MVGDINVAVQDGVATLELNRLPVLNALSPGLLRELIDLCADISDDASVRVVVLRGAGPNFSAGADLPAFQPELRDNAEVTADLGRRAAVAVASLPQVSIAAVRGHCVGGGIVLAGACDMRIAADYCRFSIPEVDAGIPLAWGGMQRLIELIGETVTTDLVLTCRPIDAPEALRIGLVSRILPGDGFENQVQELAGGIAAKASIVLRIFKQQLQALRDGSYDARNDAAGLLAARSDDEASRLGAAYIASRIGARR
jgi:enoyl-CoA hydratase/carnithine racemase